MSLTADEYFGSLNGRLNSGECCLMWL